jgi:hypothetical protein
MWQISNNVFENIGENENCIHEKPRIRLSAMNAFGSRKSAAENNSV